MSDYVQARCITCKGWGWNFREEEYTDEPAESVEMEPCSDCEGTGKIYISPHVLDEILRYIKDKR